jgi:DNA-directed RNA polymerase sigma subunit (sigma70/sigma32)
MTNYVPTAKQATAALATGAITTEAFHVLAVRYGWFGVGPLNLWDAAAHFNTERAAIRQTEAKAMHALRNLFA